MTEKNKLRGKKARAAGGRFELKVRKDLESKGWIVDKWSNNVETVKLELAGQMVDRVRQPEVAHRLIPAKRRFNPFRKALAIGTGFPDFIAYRVICIDQSGTDNTIIYYEVIGVESKINGYLDKEEKEKCKWLLDNNKFGKILIVKKGKKRGEIEYVEFKEA